MYKDNLEKVKSTQVLEMVRLAFEFCTFTEDLAKQEVNVALSFYQKLLPLMYIKGSLLPDIETSDESINERFVTEEHWEKVFMVAKEKFDKDEYFWIVDSNNDTLKVSIAEYIADIYQDMKDFIILFQDNRLAAKENAVFELKEYFAVHWGIRIAALMPVFHNIIYALKLKENDELEF